MLNSTKESLTGLTELDSLSQFIQNETSERRGRQVPPLDKWHPKNCSEMDLIIKANGEWWHEGSKISRQGLVDLFATVLWREGSKDSPEYYLKTPVEKVRIKVEDVPFLITDVNLVQKDGVQTIEFISSTGDVVYLDDEHPIEMHDYQGEERPYIMVRFAMQGLISRSVFMHLISIGELTEQDGYTILTLTSAGNVYTMAVANS